MPYKYIKSILVSMKDSIVFAFIISSILKVDIISTYKDIFIFALIIMPIVLILYYRIFGFIDINYLNSKIEITFFLKKIYLDPNHLKIEIRHSAMNYRSLKIMYTYKGKKRNAYLSTISTRSSLYKKILSPVFLNNISIYCKVIRYI